MTERISAKEFIGEQVKISKKRGSKYRNVKTVVDGITFDSKKEAQRYAELRMMELSGEIENLECQKVYDLTIEDMHSIGQHRGPVMVSICKYKADFSYSTPFRPGIRGKDIVEDVKSEITRKNPVYRIKKKLMKAIYGIDILET